MSPNEEQLRRALRSGEGEPLDAAAMITHARTVRHTRRVRLTSVAATVFAVAAVGIGSAVAFGTHHASTPAADPGSSTHPTDGSTLRVTATAANPSPTAQVNCPVTVPHLMLPGGGGSGQFGANGPLFDG
ncbi:MAG: hypothetical protein ABI232_09190, partial [Jatrophihabitantaceae bacterium]